MLDVMLCSNSITIMCNNDIYQVTTLFTNTNMFVLSNKHLVCPNWRLNTNIRVENKHLSARTVYMLQKKTQSVVCHSRSDF